MTVQRKEGSSFGQKLGKFLLVVVPIAVAVWLFNIATDARAIAQTNAELVREPTFQLSFIPGGPERFADSFAEAVEVISGDDGAFSGTEDEAAEDEVLDPTQYLWSTLIVRNVGVRDADDIQLAVNALAPIDHLLVAPPGWNNEVTVEMGEETNVADVSLSYLDQGDEALVFIGSRPEGFEAPYDRQTYRAWAQNFLLYFNRFVVESDLAEGSFYGYGYEPVTAVATE